MKKVIFTVLIFCFTLLSHATRIGEWKTYMAYHYPTETAVADDVIYVLANHGLYAYTPSDNSIRTYSRVELLNDCNITHIAYSKVEKTLVIVYKNGNIDLLINGEEVYNISDLLNKSTSEDKTINRLKIYDSKAFLATSYGVVTLDLQKREITNSYNFGKHVNDLVFLNNSIYAATTEGLYEGNTTENLLDPSHWVKVNNKNIVQMVNYKNSFAVLALTDGVYKFDLSTRELKTVMKGSLSSIAYLKDELLLYSGTLIFFVRDAITHCELNESIKHLNYDSKTQIYWASTFEKGLMGYQYNATENKLEPSISSIVPNSPTRNLDYKLVMKEDYLLIAGGSYNLYGIYNPGTVMKYTFENNNWLRFEDGNTIKEKTGLHYRNVTNVIEDPTDATHHFVGTIGTGLYEFKDFKLEKRYSYKNSPLRNILFENPYSVWVEAMTYDKDHNLWLANDMVKTILHVLKSDGTWVSLEDTKIAEVNHFSNLFFDRRGWLWMNAHNGNPGVYCLNYNGTLEDQSDDESVYIDKIINQDGKTIQSYFANCIVQDNEGAMWLGTDHGPLVIYNPSRIFKDNFYFTQIKVPRNDGSNLADYLLENEMINAIAVDGANRKWIGTNGSGLYLLSANGMETLHHFTKENSPLLSNSILSLAIREKTGELFIGTSEGLISYQSDATRPNPTFLSDIHAFPNPVKPDYEGVITVTGMVLDSNIKIINTAGKLIIEGTSLGGQFTWDGKNAEGQRVASGIYYVLATDAEGKEGIVTKILMIK